MKLRKLFIAITAVTLIAAAPVFAKGKMQNDNCAQNSKQRDYNNNGKATGDNRMQIGKGGLGGRQADLMGTIKSIDTNKSTIVVTDADGKDFTVHINPQTRIAVCTKTEVPPDAATDTQTTTRKRSRLNANESVEVSIVKLSELNKNDWVQISKYETDTTVLEANHIEVIRESK